MTSATSVNITENTASIQGGGVYYNFRRPMLTNVSYDSNLAPYGSDIASYAVRIAEVDYLDQNMTLTDVASGITLNESPISMDRTGLQLAIVDVDNQVMNLMDIGTVKIREVTDQAETTGITEARIIQGVAEFDDIGFTYSPGATNIQFEATSSEIDAIKTETIDLTTDDSITVDFRFCQPGETIIDDTT